jgi:hypothetical protein
VNLPAIHAGFIGGPSSEPELPTEDEIRRNRIASARKCSRWQEIRPDLVHRDNYFWVSAATDAVFVRYRGEVWNVLGGIDFAEQNPLYFTVDGSGIELYERHPQTWSEIVFGRERARAR